MKVFSKYLLKSITEKKGRTFLLLLSIAISGALLVASMGSVKALLGTLTDQIKGNLGEYNVSIYPSASSESRLFSDASIDYKGINKSFKEIDLGGYLSSNSEKEFSLVGTTLSDIQNYKETKIIKKDDLEPFTGKKVIISDRTSKNLKVKLGDDIKLNILGKEYSYKVAAIAANRGLFFMDKEKQFSLVTPEENVSLIYGEKGKYSSMFVVVKDKNIDAWIKTFNSNHKADKIVASKIYDEASIEQQLNEIKTPLYFMLAIVLLMTAFIIYSSFKLIITERLSVIGVFLSQGATKGSIIKILLKESLAYGVLGGIIGDLIGAGLTALISIYGNPLKDYGVEATINFYPPYLVIGFLFAMALSILSTLIPILSTRKLPVKDVILNTISTSNKVSLKGFIVGIVAIICAAALHFTGSKISYAGAVPSVFLGLVGVMLIMPKLVDITVRPIVRFLKNINGLSMLSFNNIRTSKVLLNNMRLISISVIAIVMITSIAASITNVVKGAYDTMHFDVRVGVQSNYLKNINDIITKYGDATSITQTGGIATSLNGDSTKMVYLDYMDPEKFKTYENYTVFEDKNEQLDELNKNDDGIIISKQISVRYNVKKGDTITLNTDDKKETFKVLSIFDAKMMDGGNFNLISLKGAQKHFDVKYPTEYYISTKIPAKDAKKALEKQLKGLGANVITKAEMQKSNEEGNKQMTDILSIFSYITMVIGAFGILGNVSISFIQRKRDMAVISSVGLSKGGRGYMVLLEGLFQALIGGILSLVMAYGINLCVTDVFKFLTMDLDLQYPYKSIGTVLIATIVLMLLTSLSSLIKSNKLQIVKELKYE